MIQIVLCLEIVAFTALVMSAIFLAVAYIPHERKVLNVKRSKNLVQLASVLLGSSGIVLWHKTISCATSLFTFRSWRT